MIAEKLEAFFKGRFRNFVNIGRDLSLAMFWGLIAKDYDVEVSLKKEENAALILLATSLALGSLENALEDKRKNIYYLANQANHYKVWQAIFHARNILFIVASVMFIAAEEIDDKEDRNQGITFQFPMQRLEKSIFMLAYAFWLIQHAKFISDVSTIERLYQGDEFSALEMGGCNKPFESHGASNIVSYFPCTISKELTAYPWPVFPAALHAPAAILVIFDTILADSTKSKLSHELPTGFAAGFYALATAVSIGAAIAGELRAPAAREALTLPRTRTPSPSPSPASPSLRRTVSISSSGSSRPASPVRIEASRTITPALDLRKASLTKRGASPVLGASKSRMVITRL